MRKISGGTVLGDENDQNKHNRAYQSFKLQHGTLDCRSKSNGFKNKFRLPKFFECNQCGKQFDKRPSFMVHLNSHEEKSLQCLVCLKMFHQRSHLNRHKLTHTNKYPFECAICGRTFREKNSVRKHLCIHSNENFKFECGICGRRFTEKNSVKKHLSVHSNEKPFKCEECGKCFRLKANVYSHMYSHDIMKQFKCSECGKTYTKNSSLADHLVTHSIYTGHYSKYFNINESEDVEIDDQQLNPFECMECGKSFTYKRSLRRHLDIHIGAKFECVNCGLFYSRKDSLHAHLVKCKKRKVKKR